MSKALLSKGISDIAYNEAINNQLKAKFPRRKMAIPSPTEAQWNEERTSIDREILRKSIMQLKSQVYQVSPAFAMNTYKQSFSVNTRKPTASPNQPLTNCILYLMTLSRAGYRGTSIISGMVQAKQP